MVAGKERACSRALRRAVTALNSDASLQQVLETIVRGTARAMETGASLVLLDATGTKLIPSYAWGMPRSYLQKGVLDAGKSLTEVISGQPMAIADASQDSHLQYPDIAANAGIASILGVPIIVNGKPTGSIRVYTRERTDFSKQDINFVMAMANLAAVALRCQALHQQIEVQMARGQAEAAALRQARSVTFAHPSEEEFAHILDFYNIEWVYEPRSFPLKWVGEQMMEMFTPDFYLPGLDLYVELTTMKQSHVTEKNHKLRRLRELYPEIKITLLYKRDFDRLLAKYGVGPLAQARGRGVGRVLYSNVEIQQRVKELAEQISRDYADRHPVMVGVLRGVFCFMADLVRQMSIPLDVEFMSISHYGGSIAAVKITKDLDLSITGKHVIMVEDIVDTGLTLNYMLDYLKAKRPASLAVCTFLDKRVRRIVDVPLDYIGFEVPDEFVVGYGLDYQEEYRNLPFIGILGQKEAEGKQSSGVGSDTKKVKK